MTTENSKDRFMGNCEFDNLESKAVAAVIIIIHTNIAYR